MALFGKPQYSTVTVKKKDIPKDLWDTLEAIIYEYYQVSSDR